MSHASPGTPAPVTSGSDELYRGLLHSLDHGFCILEMIFDEQDRPVDYRFLEINRTFERQTGLREALGRRARELVPELEEHWFELYGRVALTGEPLRAESGSMKMGRWFRLNAFRFGGAESRRVALVFSDITAEKLANARADFLISLSEQLGHLTDEKEIIRATCRALGTHLDTDRCYFVECLEEEDRIIVSENHCREGTVSVEGTHGLSDFGGKEWWAEYTRGDFAVDDVTTHPLTRDRVGRYSTIGIGAYVVQPYRSHGAWTVVLGITESRARAWREDEVRLVDDVVARAWPMVERARADRALVQSREDLAEHAQTLESRVDERTARLQETVSELETFSYSISHDLRAPLRAMQTFASILSSEHADELAGEAKDYLRRIISASERMDRLIEDVLVYSRISRIETRLEPIELSGFITGIVETYPQFRAAAAHIEIPARLGAVLASPAALTQCVSNLLGNALKFVPKTRTPRIRLSSEVRANEERGMRRRLYVEDNGIGIDAAAQLRIFDIFYQVDVAPGGTGIGLAVVRKAAERMGGSVGVRSVEGQGSTFCLELAAAPDGSA